MVQFKGFQQNWLCFAGTRPISAGTGAACSLDIIAFTSSKDCPCSRSPQLLQSSSAWMFQALARVNRWSSSTYPSRSSGFCYSSDSLWHAFSRHSIQQQWIFGGRAQFGYIICNSGSASAKLAYFAEFLTDSICHRAQKSLSLPSRTCCNLSTFLLVKSSCRCMFKPILFPNHFFYIHLLYGRYLTALKLLCSLLQRPEGSLAQVLAPLVLFFVAHNSSASSLYMSGLLRPWPVLESRCSCKRSWGWCHVNLLPPCFLILVHVVKDEI